MTRRKPPSDFSGRGGRCGTQVARGTPAAPRAAAGPATAARRWWRCRFRITSPLQGRGRIRALRGPGEGSPSARQCLWRVPLTRLARSCASPTSPRKRGEVESAPARRLVLLLDPPAPGPGRDRAARAGSSRRSPSAAPRENPLGVEARALWAAAKSARRSNELSGGGFSPVCEPTPAVPFSMPGLSSFSSAGAIGGKLLARRLGAGRIGGIAWLPGCSGGFAIAASMGGRRAVVTPTVRSGNIVRRGGRR